MKIGKSTLLNKRGLSRRKFFQYIASGAFTLSSLASFMRSSLFAESLTSLPELVWIQGQSAQNQQLGIWSTEDSFTVFEKTFRINEWSFFPFHKFDDQALKEKVVVLEGCFPVDLPIDEWCSKSKLVILLGNEGSSNIWQNSNYHNLVKTFSSLDLPLISLPGYPVPFRHFVGTLIHLSLYGVPDLDGNQRPKMFYQNILCDFCEYRKDLETGNFVNYIGEKKGCLYKLGCKGFITRNTCSQEYWNGTKEWCVSVGSPCTGCSEASYPDHFKQGMYGQDERYGSVLSSSWLTHIETLGKIIFGSSVAFVTTHAMSKKKTKELETDKLEEYYLNESFSKNENKNK